MHQNEQQFFFLIIYKRVNISRGILHCAIAEMDDNVMKSQSQERIKIEGKKEKIKIKIFAALI